MFSFTLTIQSIIYPILTCLIFYYFSLAFTLSLFSSITLQLIINFPFVNFNLILSLFSFQQNYKKDNDREQRTHLSVQTNRAVTKNNMCANFHNICQILTTSDAFHYNLASFRTKMQIFLSSVSGTHEKKVSLLQRISVHSSK